MPKYFADHHDEYVAEWKESGHHIKLNRTSYLWGSTSDGHCFSMLMFVKLVPLPHKQDYAFFSSFEKLDDQAEVVCSQWGEVIGTGKLLPKILRVSPRFLQEAQPNIQVFLPLALDYFL
jgi:hypothetical protein